MDKKIIQTPSHLHLFEKVIHKNKVHDYRDSMKKSCEQEGFVKVFFSEENIRKLGRELNSMVQSKYDYKAKEIDKNLVLMVMTNVYNDSIQMNIEAGLVKLNQDVLSHGLGQYYQALIGQVKFLKDRNNIHELMIPPQMTSNKIDKQLPRMNFI